MANRFFRTTTSVFGLLGVVAFAPAPALAQEGAGASNGNSEIVVTAQRRSEASRDVPITVTTLGAEQLAQANVNSLSDTVKLTTALRFDAQSSFVQPSIRGVGTAITTSGGGPNVGIYVDGFFQSNPEVADFQLMRVKSIQVLKGPQGTLFGRNTTGGAILVTTADPSTTPGAEFKASYGRFDALSLQGYGTFGLAENVAMDVEGMYKTGDGFVHNVATDSDKDGKYENWSARVGLKADLSDSVSVLLRYAHSDTDDPTAVLTNAFVDNGGTSGVFSQLPDGTYGNPSAVGLPLVFYPLGFIDPTLCNCTTKPGQIDTLIKNSFTNKSNSLQGTVKADLGFADLTSYSQWRHDKSRTIQDLDGTVLSVYTMHLPIDNETYSQEFLLTSKPGGPLQWTAGLMYYQNRDAYDFSVVLPSPYPPLLAITGSSTTTKSYAAFLDATYQVTDKFFITAGGRFSHDVVTDAYLIVPPYIPAFGLYNEYTDANGVRQIGVDYSRVSAPALKKNSFTPRVVLRYKPTEDSSIYASWTRGYKAGILNVGSLSLQAIKPEKIDAFEGGYKFDNRTVSIEVAGYYYDYKNLQVSSFQNGAAQIRNAASSEIYGLEGQFRYRVTQDLTLNAGAAWTHARYKKFPNAPFYSYCDPSVSLLPTEPYGTLQPLQDPMACSGVLGQGSLTQTTIDASGFHMQRSPEFTANLGVSYGLDVSGGRLTLSGNLAYTSSFYFDPTQQFKEKGYENLGLRAEWADASDHFTVAVYGENVTNNRYRTQAQYNTNGINAGWNAPVTYGVQLGVKY